MSEAARLGSSFRDPSGFVYRAGGVLYRQINSRYASEWHALTSSGLLAELAERDLIVPHDEAPLASAYDEQAAVILRPEPIPFVSYPYEWCFSQLKDAALATLEIQKLAIQRGMSLKDASAYNIQFMAGHPVLIDTLSFETYREGEPWIAYGQFCRHFLAPLSLMALVDVRLGALMRVHLDGIPLDLAAHLLPGSSKLRGGLLAHIHVHARASRGDARHEADPRAKSATLSRTAMLALVDSLESTVGSLSWEPKATEWADYYADTNYSETAMREKRRLVDELIGETEASGGTCWDLGSNTGEFAKLAAKRGYFTVALDGDRAAIEKAYLSVKASNENSVLPLCIDLANPSPSLGWESAERDSLIARGPADLVLSLALVHHLAIGNNVPLPLIADFFGRIGRNVICEFVPKEDGQVQRLLRSREDIFSDYDEAGFEAAMGERFDIARREPIPETKRMLYLLRKR